jgi:hypothetical protein
MISGHRKFFESRLQERGYTIEEVRPCIISEDGEQITVDENHPSYPSKKKDGFIPQTKQRNIESNNVNKPGTELKKLLKKIGIKASPNCSCNKRAALMDQWGPDECEKRIDEIVGWLREEANKRNLPFIDMAGRILVKKAIKNSRKK